jgi:hypothetical protein
MEKFQSDWRAILYSTDERAKLNQKPSWTGSKGLRYLPDSRAKQFYGTVSSTIEELGARETNHERLN